MKTKYLLILIIFAISCKPENKELIKFDPTTLTENEISLTEIADDIKYIPLDNKYPLGRISDRIIFINNSIYLTAENVGVLVFNKEGTRLRKIGNIGRGPGEYLYSSVFTVDEKTETIYIHDRGDIIKVFSHTGGYLRSFSLKEYGHVDAIESYNSKLFAFYSNQYENTEYEWIVFDTLGNQIKKKERNTPEFAGNALGIAGTYKHENVLTYWNNYSDTVFSILPDLNQKPSFIISPGRHRLPKSRITPETMSDYMWFKYIYETSRYIVINYFYPLKKYSFVLIDKDNNKSFLIDLKSDNGGVTLIGGILNDLDGGTSFLPKNYFVENGREFLIGLIYPYQIKTHIKSTEFINSTPKYPEKKTELEKLAASLKETDNPVLVLVRLKK